MMMRVTTVTVIVMVTVMMGHECRRRAVCGDQWEGKGEGEGAGK
jgi:hypothetical protein